MNQKLKELASTIVDYSLKVKENDKVLITSYTDKPKPLIKKLIKKIYEKNAVPTVKFIDNEILALEKEYANDLKIKLLQDIGRFEVDNYDCFINIRYTTNEYENSGIDKEINKKIGASLQEVDDIRINKRRWVLLNYPSKLDAYKAKMPTDKYFNYAIDVMNYNYSKMYDDIKPLKELMEKTDNVRIIAKDTDITFSIKGMNAIPCCGSCNIPDGEIYTAPVKDSVNGIITYNTPSPYQGNIFNKVSLKFRDGKIIEATCDGDNKKLNEIFDTDEGARYIGEFAIGINPLVRQPMGDILYDEKIIGSIHFTPGRAYEDAFNGNISAIHWDLVLIGREDYGGSEIYFDHKLVRKDGKFVIDGLKQLNYDIN